jgi:WD40 repeat protein
VAREHTHRLSALSFGNDGRSLATASFDRTLKIWDTETGKVLRSWTAHIGIIPGLSFSPEGKRLASSGGEDKVVKIWDPMTGREILNLRGHASTCYCVAFSPDGRQLASAGGDGTIRIWDATPTKPSEAMESAICKHDGEVWSVQFSPDGHLLASGSWDSTVRVWEARTGANLQTFTLPRPGSAFCVAFSPDSRQLAAATLSAGNRPAVMTWDLQTGKEFLLRQEGLLFCVLFDPSGRFLLREGPDFSIHVRDVLNHREMGMLGQHGHNIWGMTFSGDGKSLATASSDGRLKVWAWDPARMGHPREPALDLPIRVFGYGERVAFSIDGERLFAGGEEITVKMWDSKTGQELPSMRGHSGEVWAIAVDPQGRWLASAGEDSTIRIWDAKSFKPVLTLRGHRGVIMSLAFSPDGERLASGSRDRTVRLWETARWGKPRIIR